MVAGLRVSKCIARTRMKNLCPGRSPPPVQNLDTVLTLLFIRIQSLSQYVVTVCECYQNVKINNELVIKSNNYYTSIESSGYKSKLPTKQLAIMYILLLIIQRGL